MILRSFNMLSFSNSILAPEWPTNFLDGLGFVGLPGNDAILLSSSVPDGISEDLTDDFVTTTWRYAADPAEHNKGKFDIWMELTVLNQHFVIRNWE
jgi:hypothetical protein